MIPETIYKYKSISFKQVDFTKTKEIIDSNDKKNYDNSNIGYILDIIQEHRLYCATLNELNDPFEALHLSIFGDGTAGGSLYSSKGIVPPYTYKRFAKYRILSLTDNPKSHLMWGLYANNYQGICIGFSTKNSLNCIKKVTYLTEQNEKPFCWVNDPLLEEKIVDSLYKKFKCWENESEYRIVQKDRFVAFNQGEIKHLIIGHNVPETYKKMLTQLCKKQNIPVFITYPDRVKREILIKDIHFQPIYDGREIKSNL